MKHVSVFQENASIKKDSPLGGGVFKFPQPSLALSQQHHHRPCSFPGGLPHSPLTQEQHYHHHTPSPSSTTSEETRLHASSLNSAGSSGNLIKQISFPLVCRRLHCLDTQCSILYSSQLPSIDYMLTFLLICKCYVRDPRSYMHC